MRDKLGEIFTGTISGVAAFGVFIALDELYVEGLLHVDQGALARAVAVVLDRRDRHLNYVLHHLVCERVHGQPTSRVKVTPGGK